MEPYLREHEPIFSLVLFDIRVQVEEVFLFPEIKIALSATEDY